MEAKLWSYREVMDFKHYKKKSKKARSREKERLLFHGFEQNKRNCLQLWNIWIQPFHLEHYAAQNLNGDESLKHRKVAMLFRVSDCSKHQNVVLAFYPKKDTSCMGVCFLYGFNKTSPSQCRGRNVNKDCPHSCKPKVTDSKPSSSASAKSPELCHSPSFPHM